MSPRGQEHVMARGTGTVNNKIYYPSVSSREGAEGDCCSLELAVRYGEADCWVIPKRMQDWRFRVVHCRDAELRIECKKEHGRQVFLKSSL